MEKELRLYDSIIKIKFDEGIIRVYSNAQLWQYVNGKAKERLTQLAEAIKNEYAALFSKPLQISTKSLILEILVHVYCDYLGLAFNRYVRITGIQKLVKKLLLRAEVVDCGETAKDGNRWVWDLLTPFNGAFFAILPDNLNATNLKKY
ncbi:hypothetical protein [Pedobacter frigidisoli]|uniref:hypothetical protein n=1 Tax=Pedobacter frigidisoli TaxID=2530455 RepID=UPI0029316425|nr:hypothetical protein [Pedobacter frigidisoli]